MENHQIVWENPGKPWETMLELDGPSPLGCQEGVQGPLGDEVSTTTDGLMLATSGGVEQTWSFQLA